MKIKEKMMQILASERQKTSLPIRMNEHGGYKVEPLQSCYDARHRITCETCSNRNRYVRRREYYRKYRKIKRQEAKLR